MLGAVGHFLVDVEPRVGRRGNVGLGMGCELTSAALCIVIEEPEITPFY